MKDGVFLSDFSSEHFYKIQSVSRSDAGDYRCYAKNSVGTIISEKIKLTVACKESLLLLFYGSDIYFLKKQWGQFTTCDFNLGGRVHTH